MSAPLSVARDTSSGLLEFRCDVPTETARERLSARRRADVDASDATDEIAVRMAARADPWPGAITIDTSSSPEEAVAACLSVMR